MPNYDDRLKDYVDVKERIKLFYERHPDGRLVTAELSMSEDPDGTVRVWGKALAYRTPEDPLPGTGTSYMAVPGTTPYTRGSEAENVETSCWGRAIGSLGIGIDKSVASLQEVASKEGADTIPAVERREDGGLIGTVEIGKSRDSDYELRETPDGWALGFRLKDKAGSIKVLAKDAAALALAANKDETVGARVTCWGSVRPESFTPAKSNRKVTYQVLDLERIVAPAFTFPVPDGEPVEATPEPLFPPLDEEERALIAGSLP
jgi:hypothetical protein